MGVTTWFTGFRGRSFRGRTFWAGINTDRLVNPNTFTTQYAGVLDAWAAGLLNVMETGIFTPVVLSRYANKQPRALGLTTPINSHETRTAVHTLRRRLTGGS